MPDTIAELTRQVQAIDTKILALQVDAAAKGIDPVRSDPQHTYGDLLADWMDARYALNEAEKGASA